MAPMSGEAPEKRIRFKGLIERLSEIDVKVTRNIEFIRTSETGEAEPGQEDADGSHFADVLAQWAVRNRTQDFSDCAGELRPLSKSLHMVVFNLTAIVDILLRHLEKPNSQAAEPLLMLVGALARDVRSELTPYFGRIFSVLTGVLNAAIREGNQHVDVAEQVFQSLAYLLKYLARYVADNLPAYLETYAVLLCHKKPYVSHFASETLAFILRRLRAGRAEEAIADLFGLLRAPTRAAKELEVLANSLSVIFAEAVKGVQHSFHSQMPHLLQPLLRCHVRFDEAASLSPEARAAHLWAVKAALLRMRNHAVELDATGDILEIILEHCRSALKRLSKAANAERGAVGDLAPPGSAAGPLGMAPEEQEVLFYVDLLTDWVYAKPRPRGDETGWGAYAEAVLEILAAALPPARRCRGVAGACGAAAAAPEPSAPELRFPPRPVPAAEAVVRAAALLWRALPDAVGPLCDADLTELLLGGHGPSSNSTALPEITFAEDDATDVLNLLAASVVPQPLPGIQRTPLLSALLGRAVGMVASSDGRRVEMRASASWLCAELLHGAGEACLSEAGGVLSRAPARSALLRHLLAAAEAAVADRPEGEEAPRDPVLHVVAAVRCAVELLHVCRTAKLRATLCSVSGGRAEEGVTPAEAASRLARLVPRAGELCRGAGLTEEETRGRMALLRSRLLNGAALAIAEASSSGGSSSSTCTGPPADAWPGGCSPVDAPMGGLAAWAAWTLAWALQEPLQAPLVQAAGEVLTILAGLGGEAEAPLLARLPLGRALAGCRLAGSAEAARLRGAAVRLAGLLPEALLLRPFCAPAASVASEAKAARATEEEETWPALLPAQGAASDEVLAQGYSEALRELLDLCQSLENLELALETERQRADLMRRVARAVRRLPTGCWVGMMSVQLLAGQLFVRFSPAWKAAQEALLQVAAEPADLDPNAAASAALSRPRAAAGRKKKRRRKSADGDQAAPPEAEDAAEQAEEQGTEEPASKKGKRKRQGGADGEAVVEPAKSTGQASKRPQAPEGQAGKEEEVERDEEIEDEEEKRPAETRVAELEDIALDKWLQPAGLVVKVDWKDAPPEWWWSEAVWAAALQLILAYEAPPERTPLGEEERRPQRAALPTRQRKDRHAPWMLGVEGPLAAADAPLWRGGAEGWRLPLEGAWEELSSWQVPSTNHNTVHDMAWQLVTKLLEQNHWHGGRHLEPWQKELRRHHNQWVLAKFLQHLRSRYGCGRVGHHVRREGKASLLHALRCVAAMPSVEACAKPLVDLCIHGCQHWLLMEQDTQLQELAVTVLARCRRRMPHMAICEPSLKRLCGDITFHDELLWLSVSTKDEGVDVAVPQTGEADGAQGLERSNALYEHREALLPAVLRILFSKATKGGRALDKHSSRTSRRSSIYSYLSALIEAPAVPELLLVLLEPLLTALAPSSGAVAALGQGAPELTSVAAVNSALRKSALLRCFLASRADDDAGKGRSWWQAPVQSLDVVPGMAQAAKLVLSGLAPQAPCGWTWALGVGPVKAPQLQPASHAWLLLEPFATGQQWLGLMQTLGDVIPQMAGKLLPYATFLAEILGSLLERLGSIVREKARSGLPEVVRQLVRQAVLRVRDLLEKYPEKVPALIAALKPAGGTLEFLFERLAIASGSVEVSSIVLLARSWAQEPTLFGCFEDLCPGALKLLFRVPAAPAVRAMVVKAGGRAGNVVPMISDIALRLCQGGVRDLKAQKKERRRYLDVRKEQKRRRRLEGDVSDEELEEDEDDGPGVGMGISKAEMEENTRRGVALLRPNVDVLLASLHELVRLRLQHREPVRQQRRRPGQRGKGGQAALRGVMPVVTLTEINVLASVSEWCTDVSVAQQLVGLLVTALSTSVRDSTVGNETMLLMASALRRLVFIALPAPTVVEGSKTVAEGAKAVAGADGAAVAEVDADVEATGEQGLTEATSPSATTGSEPQRVAAAVGRLLGLAKDVSLRAQLGELLVEVEALRAFGASAKEYLEAAAKLPPADRWRPDANPTLSARFVEALGKGVGFVALHVAHLVAALNSLRRSSLKEPDVDAHVDLLHVLCDQYALPAPLAQEAPAKEGSPSTTTRLPAVLLPPLLAHGLFILRCEGVDSGVEHGIERFFCTLADRVALMARSGEGDLEDAPTVLRLLMSTVLPSLRKLLRASREESYRAGLRVLGHIVRTLGPHCKVLQSWENPRGHVGEATDTGSAGVAGSVASAEFGASAEAMLHVDLLPLLRAREAKGDEGGDLFGNLLHLQKHRRGRGLVALSKAAQEGKLTSNTRAHFVMPICMQALLQRSSTTTSFDPNYANLAIMCLGECMRGVAWGVCFQTVRQLAGLLEMKDAGRERWLVRAACECLGHFPFPERPLPGPELLDGFRGVEVEPQEEKLPGPEEELEPVMPEREEAQSAGEAPQRSGKGKGKGRSKGRGKGQGRGRLGKGKFARSFARPKGSTADSKDSATTGTGSGGGAAASSMVKSLRFTVLPMLKKMVWQKEPGKQAPTNPEASSGQKDRSSGGLVRIAVISVMMHCVRHLPPDDFSSELPRVVSMAVSGLQDRDADHRRAARQAVQSIATSLGPAWLGWLLKELRLRLERGFMLPVCSSAALAALQALNSREGQPLQPGDLDPAFEEVMAQVVNELNRSLDASKPDAEQDETTRPGQVPEAKKLKGPEFMLIAAQFASPRLVTEALWKLEGRLRGEIAEQADVVKRRGKNRAHVPLPPQTMLHLHRVEELMQKAASGLCLNASFTPLVEASFVAELLDSTAKMLEGSAAGVAVGAAGGGSKMELEKDDDNKNFVLQPARSRQELMAVQPGAAAGRSAGLSNSVMGRSANRIVGFDAHACAGALGNLGLRLLRHLLKLQRAAPPLPAASEAAPAAAEAAAASTAPAAAGAAEAPPAEAAGSQDVAEALQGKIVPSVVQCFCSKQDKLFVASAKCLGLLRGHYSARPEVLQPHGAEIARKVLKTFEIVASAPQLSQHLRAKANQRGLSSVGAAATLATCTRLLSALLNSRSSVEWFMPLAEQPTALPALLVPRLDVEAAGKQEGLTVKVKGKKKGKAAAAPLEKSTFFDALLLHIRNAIDQPALQASALQLLRRVLLRNRVLTLAVYQCVDAVGEVMITGCDKRMAQVCAQIYVDFMLDYPHEDKAVQRRLSHLARNLGYGEEGGRRAVLNCLYLVVLHFPEAELEKKWGALLFAAAAARLPQEPDATAHRMLHVLIKTLLQRIGGGGRQRLLELALPWGRSPKRAMHAALAECVGLFAEAGGVGASGLPQLLATSLPTLAAVLRAALEAEAADAASLAPSSVAQPWRAAYAASRAFERLLAVAPLEALEKLLAEGAEAKAAVAAGASIAPASAEAEGAPRAEEAAEAEVLASAGAEEEEGAGKKKPKRKGKKRRRSEDAEAGDAGPGTEDSTAIAPTGEGSVAAASAVPSLSPGEALQLIWRLLLGGSQDSFAPEERHSWTVAVALRVLEAQAVRFVQPPQAEPWLSAAASAGAGPPAVSAPGLLRGLELLLASERLEAEPSLAPLVVRSLRSLLRLLLRSPCLMPEGPMLAGAAASNTAEGDLEDAEEEEEQEEEDGCSVDPEDAALAEKLVMEGGQEQEVAKQKELAATPVVGKDAGEREGLEEDSKKKSGDESDVGEKDEKEDEAMEDGGKKKAEEDDDEGDEKKKAEEDEDEEDDNNEGEDIAGGAVEDSRCAAGQSLFDAVVPTATGGEAEEANITREAATAAELSAGPPPPTSLPATVVRAEGEAAVVLRRSRGRWLIVRLSHRARGFLSRPLQHFVRLVSIFRLLASLVDVLPEDVLVLLLEPLLSPVYRCTSAFGTAESSSLPDVQTLDQALNLRSNQRMEYLAQLARACSDALASKLQDAGLSSNYAQALAKVRRAVDRHRAERKQRRRLKPVTDPQAAARQKRVKSRRKQAGKKRKLDEMIITKKGAKGSIRVKKSQSLI